MSRIEQRIDLVVCSHIYKTTMFIPYAQDRVVQKDTGAICLVVFVNIHDRTADLFAPHGAGDLIKGVPFAELAPTGIKRTGVRRPMSPDSKQHPN